MDSHQKTVLIVQPSKHQAQVWQSALISQGLSVILEASGVDLIVMLSQMKNSGLNLPNLILLDLAASKASPYVFCRWCRDNYPDLNVVLTNAGQKAISEPERDWAIYQGAQDLLPGFQRETLLTGVVGATNRVLEVMGLPPSHQDKLIQVLFSMTGNTNSGSHSAVNLSLSTPSTVIILAVLVVLRQLLLSLWDQQIIRVEQINRPRPLLKKINLMMSSINLSGVTEVALIKLS